MNRVFRLVRWIIPITGLLFASCSAPTPTPLISQPSLTPLPTETLTPPPTLTPDPSATPSEPTPDFSQLGILDPACPVGTWEMQDVPGYLSSVIPQDIQKKGTITIQSSSGSLRYTFANDSRVIAQATNFKLSVLVNLNETAIPLAIELDGAGYGKFTADPALGVLTLTDLVNSDMTLTATLGTVPLAKKTPITDLTWFGANTQNNGAQFKYQCHGNDSLTLIVTKPNSDLPALLPITLTPVTR